MNAKKLKWEKTPSPPYPAGTKRKVLWTDTRTGASAALFHHLKGAIVEAHSHPSANEKIYVLKGNMGGLTAGTFSFIPKGVRHGPLKVTAETIVLAIWDGPR